jgi:hypothetical protein
MHGAAAGGFEHGAVGGEGFGAGGFNHGAVGGARYGATGYGAAGFHNAGLGNYNHLPTDTGFGNLSGQHVPQSWNHSNLTTQGQNIRNSFNHNYNQYNFNNFGGYHGYGGYGYHGYGGYGYGGYGGWGYGGWGWNPAMAWTFAGVTSLASLGTFLGIAALDSGSHNSQPVSYSNVTYNGGNVYIDGQPEGSSEQFYQQAQQLAGTAYNWQPPQQSAADYSASGTASGTASGANPLDVNSGTNSGVVPNLATEQWRPLGAFALAEPGQTDSDMVLQMAINPDGIISGEYLNQLTNESSQIYGALNKKTQRVSWTIGKNPKTVFDAGLADLTKGESTVLVHYGPNNTQRMGLIRLEKPPQEPTAPAEPTGAAPVS